MLIAENQQPNVIAARLGHKSVRTVLDVYGHLYEGLDDAAADALNTTWALRAADSSRTRTG
jgi:integrase